MSAAKTLINPDELMAALSARLLPPPDAAERSGIPLALIYDILGRRSRRDERGLVSIEPDTARKLAKLLDEVKPVLRLVVEPQGPRRLRDVPVDMTRSLFPEERTRTREKRNREEAAARATDSG